MTLRGASYSSVTQQKETRDGRTCKSSFGSPTSNNHDPDPSPGSLEPASTFAGDDFFALLELRVVGIVKSCRE